MNLISCGNCGIVFDKDQLKFPAVRDIDYVVIKENVVCIRDSIMSFVPCPICSNKIPGEED